VDHSGEVMKLDEASFDAAVSDGLTLVDFWAPWCGPCHMLTPVLEELAGELADTATVAKVNVDEAPHLAARFGVHAIPLLVLLKDGREVARFIGLHAKSDLKAAISRAA